MSRTTMIVLLAVCGFVLIIAVIALIPRIKNALAGVPLIVYLGIVAALVAVIALLVIGLFGPRGSDSLTSADVEGVEQGDADIDTDLNEEETGTGTNLFYEEVFKGNEEGDDTIYIRVRGDKISIGGAQVEDVNAFTVSMMSLAEEAHPICLVDDYATSRTYTAVRDVLDEMDLKYMEIAE